MKRGIVLTIFLALGGGTVTPLAGQVLPGLQPGAPTPAANQPEERPVDRVLAVVGDTILLYSAVINEVEGLLAQGAIPNDPARIDQVAQQIIEAHISDMLILTAAKQANITVTDQDVAAGVDAEILDAEQRFGSPEALREALASEGRTMAGYRRDITEQLRAVAIRERYLAQVLSNRTPPVVNESEVAAYFTANQADIEPRPATASFTHVIVTPEPTDSARRAAIAEAEQVLTELREGGDFEVLARRFSDDETNAEQGGDLGWFGTGQMVPEFEDVAFGLRAGQTSGIVESDFGFHIIRVDGARIAQRQARHILIQPEVTEADIERARVRADSVLRAVQGGASIEDLAELYNSENEFVGPVAENAILAALPPEYVTAIQNATVNSVVGPFRFEHPQGPRWVVLHLTDRQAARARTLEDARPVIRQALERQKLVQRHLQDLRDRIYVLVRL